MQRSFRKAEKSLAVVLLRRVNSNPDTKHGLYERSFEGFLLIVPLDSFQDRCCIANSSQTHKHGLPQATGDTVSSTAIFTWIPVA